MYMLLEAKTTSEFEQLLQTKLKRRKIMGFGHRVYMKKWIESTHDERSAAAIMR